ncbi:MAG: serine protease [Pseudomonadota bacterium]|uniref:Trypsin-like peptidase domain-containing protein n=1 Tax=Candidatus Desulfatibia profunda TaxID=2841695 RepID=A0A8J6NKW8_9BACT|nr:trypsin-like peptidase domain-containing protein [Candidatus Desulfatibia profunda]MBL7179468.1 trypsin-like peptidase domain-containing protein [Desulfobacterales bacterium]
MGWIKNYMTKSWIVLLAWVCCGYTPAPAQEVPDVKGAMVKIYTITHRYNYNMPWQMKGQESRSGSGCIIKDRRILTNAHIVSDHAFIQVRRAGQTKKYTAKVEMVAHDCDLAVLRVADESFFSGVKPIPIGELPEIRNKVYVCGFPEGGDKLSITEGVVSRIEHSNYAHSKAFLLACQIDAAINPGNSGGPVIKDNQLVGVAFQVASSMEKVGYMIPPPIIDRFLKDIANGRYDGIPCLGVYCQRLENPDIRAFFGMSDNQLGILVTKVYQDSPAEGTIQPGDIILGIDDKKVGNDGTIEFRKGQRTFFEHTVQCRQINDTVSLEILRENQARQVQFTLSKPIGFQRLVCPEQYDVAPTYYIVGGLVFEPLTVNYLKEWGGNWSYNAPLELVRYYARGEKTVDRRQVVVMVKVLADELNAGYQEQENEVVRFVNGRSISSIQDLVRAFEENKERCHVIRDENQYTIILDKHKVDQYGPAILKKFRISSDRSPDLKP